MPLIKRFEEVTAWREARNLTKMIYQLTQDRDFRRDFGLVDQIRRASVSVMNNIVEGFESGSKSEFVRFLSYARRSGSETQSCLYVALDQTYIDEPSFRAAYDKAEEVRNLIAGFIRYLKGSRSVVHENPGT